MPLSSGKSKAAIKNNIRELISTGRSQNQSVAIALNKAGKKSAKRNIKHKLTGGY